MKRQKMTTAPVGLSQHQLDLPILPWGYHKDTFRPEPVNIEARESLRKFYIRYLRKLEKKLVNAKRANIPHWKARIAYVRLDLLHCLQELSLTGKVSDDEVREQRTLAIADAVESDYHALIYRALTMSAEFASATGHDDEAIAYCQRAIFYSYSYGARWPSSYQNCLGFLAALWSRKVETYPLAAMASAWQTLNPEKSVLAWRDHYGLVLEIGQSADVHAVVASGIGDHCEAAAKYLGALLALRRFEEADDATNAALAIAYRDDDDGWIRAFEEMPGVIDRSRTRREPAHAFDTLTSAYWTDREFAKPAFASPTGEFEPLRPNNGGPQFGYDVDEDE